MPASINQQDILEAYYTCKKSITQIFNQHQVRQRHDKAPGLLYEIGII
jgi:hypothetical protein